MCNTIIVRTDGTNNYGIAHYASIAVDTSAGCYGVNVGTSATNSNSSGALGVTTDATKSGLVAQVSQSAVNGLYLYFYVGETIQDANLVNVGRIEEKLVDCVSKSSLVEVQTVIETYQNGTSWYRVWSDGWCEQGISVTATNGTWTFLKPFSDTNYQTQMSIYRTSTSSAGWNGHMFYSSKTAASIGYWNADTSLCMLYACGYIW